MLGGIAVNNGIVLIEFVNTLRKEGYSAFDAVVEASKTRLRPILMTSLTTILGLLPLALGIGEGSELQAPLALTVMGGLTSATFLTLVFIPALYLIVAERLESLFGFQEAKPTKEIQPLPLPATIENATPLVVLPSVETTPSQEIKEEQKIELQETALSDTRAFLTNPPAEKPEERKIEEEGKMPIKEELNIRQKELLEKLKELKKITRKQYAQMFGVSIPTASRDLKELVVRKFIRAQGPLGPGRWYELV
jgi:HAE1 family hydrophobic/amphiphilic exporter-1